MTCITNKKWKCTLSHRPVSRSQIFSESYRSSRLLFPLVIPADIPSSILLKTGAVVYFPADPGLLPFPTSTVLVHPRINSIYPRRYVSGSASAFCIKAELQTINLSSGAILLVNFSFWSFNVTSHQSINPCVRSAKLGCLKWTLVNDFEAELSLVIKSPSIKYPWYSKQSLDLCFQMLISISLFSIL